MAVRGCFTTAHREAIGQEDDRTSGSSRRLHGGCCCSITHRKPAASRQLEAALAFQSVPWCYDTQAGKASEGERACGGRRRLYGRCCCNTTHREPYARRATGNLETVAAYTVGACCDATHAGSQKQGGRLHIWKQQSPIWSVLSRAERGRWGQRSHNKNKKRPVFI